MSIIINNFSSDFKKPTLTIDNKDYHPFNEVSINFYTKELINNNKDTFIKVANYANKLVLEKKDARGLSDSIRQIFEIGLIALSFSAFAATVGGIGLGAVTIGATFGPGALLLAAITAIIGITIIIGGIFCTITQTYVIRKADEKLNIFLKNNGTFIASLINSKDLTNALTCRCVG